MKGKVEGYAQRMRRRERKGKARREGRGARREGRQDGGGQGGLVGCMAVRGTGSSLGLQGLNLKDRRRKARLGSPILGPSTCSPCPPPPARGRTQCRSRTSTSVARWVERRVGLLGSSAYAYVRVFNVWRLGVGGPAGTVVVPLAPTQKPRAPTQASSRFLSMIFLTFFSRSEPAQTRKKPACMRKTSAPALWIGKARLGE